MKSIKSNSLLFTVLTGVILMITSSCERNLSDEVEFASFSKTGEIFTDDFVGLGTNFYFPFVSDGAKPDVFSVDNTEGYQSSASIRIDVPNANDPEGNFAGAGFVIDGAPRNLTGYDALTFWAKSSQAATIGSIGFGLKYRVAITNAQFTTNWKKFIIPIPDPSKLQEVLNVFEFSAGGIGSVGQEVGYSFWLDEIKFEKLGTIAQPRPAIFGGQDLVVETFLGGAFNAAPLSETFNLASGQDQLVTPTPAYFTFQSSQPNVARVNELGEVAIVGVGTAEITATLNGVQAAGSLTTNVLGQFVAADTPPVRNPDDFISIFSDAYNNVSGVNFAVFNDANVQVELVNYGNVQVIEYRNLTFVGLGWDGTVDASTMTHLHLDVQVSAGTNPALVVELIDFGPNNSEAGGDDTGGGFGVPAANLQEEGAWVGIDIPLDAFTRSTGGGFAGSPNLNNIARVVLVSNGSSIIVDNIYFYRE